MTIIRNWIVPQIEPRTGSTNPPLITTTSLPNATQALPYNFVMSATGGVPPYTWSIASASPNTGSWLSIDPASGTLSGTPSTAETETVRIKVTDSVSAPTAPTAFSLTVNAGGSIGGPAALWPGNVGLTSFAFGISPPASGPAPTAYNIYRNGVKVYNQAVSPGGHTAIPYVEDRPLANGTTYSWFATAIVNGVETGPSPTITATTLSPGPAQPPTPPAPLTWIAPYSLPTGTVWTCTNTSSSAIAGTGTLGNVGCSLNWAINGNGTTNTGYSPGDVIVLTSGASYVTDLSGQGYSFPNKANPNNLWTYVVSDQDPGFNPSGTLPASSVNTILGGGVTDYSGTGGNWVTSANAASMPVIVNQAVNGNGITLQPGANFLRFVGIAIRSPLGGSGPLTFTAALSAGATSGTLSAPFTGTTSSNYTVVFSDLTGRNVTLTNGSTAVSWSPALVNNVTATAGWILKTWAGNYCVQMPFLPATGAVPFATPCESIYFDRCRFGNDVANLYAATNGFTFSGNGLYVYGNHILAQQCSFEGFCDALQQTAGTPFYALPIRESHGFFMQGGTNICARNCRIEAISEAVFAGGNYVAQNVPITDVTISHCFVWKNPLWLTTGAVADIKNHIEFKQCIRGNVHHNVCANNVTGTESPQNAHNLVFWANDNPGNQPWTATSDIDVHDNLVVHGGSGCYFSGSDGGDVGNTGNAWAVNARMRCQNNIFFLDPPTATINSVAHPWGIIIRYNVPDTIIDHNTVIVNQGNPNWQSGTTFVGLNNTNTQAIGQLYNGNDGHTPNGRQTFSDRITVTNNVFDNFQAFGGNGLGHGITTFNTLFPAVAGATVANNLYIIDTIHYTANDFTAVGYTNVGFTSFTGAGSSNVPLPPAIANWFVTTNHNTSSTNGSAIGATISQNVFNFANFSGSPPITVASHATMGPTKIALIPLGSGHSTGSAFYTAQQDIAGGFSTTFQFQFTPAMPVPTVAGMTFCVQNTNGTDSPLGLFGANYSNDANVCGFGSGTGQPAGFHTVGVKFDANPISQNSYAIGGSPNKTGLYLNGGFPASGLLPELDMAPYGINLYNGNVMQANVFYDGAFMTWTVTDTVTGAQCRQQAACSVPNTTGSSFNWVGFTAGMVTTAVEIDVLSWQFTAGLNSRVSTPTFSPAPGQYAGTQSVTIASDPSATIYYTTNGLIPSTNSTKYTGPITVSANTIIQAIAVETTGSWDSLVASATYQISTALFINLGAGFAVGDGMVLNGSAFRSGSTIQLADTNVRGNESGSAFWGLPLNVASFTTTFTLTFSGGTQANGMTFCIQNPPKAYTTSSPFVFQSAGGGPSAIAFGQSGLGYGPDEGPGAGAQTFGLNGIALALDLFHVPNSVGLYTGGVTPTGSQVTMTGITLSSGHPMNVILSYSGTTLTFSITDSVTTTNFTTTFTVNIPTAVGGNTAYAGFTAGTGGQSQNMNVTAWTW